jgi:hypothetical protein
VLTLKKPKKPKQKPPQKNKKIKQKQNKPKSKAYHFLFGTVSQTIFQFSIPDLMNSRVGKRHIMRIGLYVLSNHHDWFTITNYYFATNAV